MRPLRQPLHDWGDGEHLHRRRHLVLRHRAPGLGRERPADLRSEYRGPGRAERDDRRHSREGPRDRSCQSTRAAGGTRLHARRADCSRGDEREQLRGHRRLGTRYRLRHPAAVGKLARVVEDAPAQRRHRARRVELHGALEDLVKALEALGRSGIGRTITFGIKVRNASPLS